MSHFQEDDILLWILTGEQVPDEAVSHAADCMSCGRTLEMGRQTAEIIRDPSLWEEQRRSPAGSAVVEVLEALEERLEDERLRADTALDSSSVDELQRFIATGGGTVGMIQVLIDRSFGEVERNPDAGLRYAQLAVLGSQMLSNSEYGGTVVSATRGQALKQRANALRVKGKLTEALADVELSANAFLQTAVPDPEIASLQYIRATIYYEQGRMKEARQLLEEAIIVFRRFGDDQRLRNATLLLSGLRGHIGDGPGAIELARDLLMTVPPGEAAFRGRVLNLLGDLTLPNDPSRAESYLQQARHCFHSAGLRTEAFRAIWNLGRAARSQGKLETADEILEQASLEAEDLGLEVDIALVTLDRAELFLETGRAEHIAQLCRHALDTFQDVDAPGYAAQAFAYLAEASKRELLSYEHLKFVRDFFTEAAENSQTDFTPPLS